MGINENVIILKGRKSKISPFENKKQHFIAVNLWEIGGVTSNHSVVFPQVGIITP